MDQYLIFSDQRNDVTLYTMNHTAISFYITFLFLNTIHYINTILTKAHDSEAGTVFVFVKNRRPNLTDQWNELVSIVG